MPAKVSRRAKTHQKTRGNPDNLELNHVGNISRYCRFAHNMMKKDLSHEELTILYFNHITALVSCLETYHRDLITLVLVKNQQLRDKAISSYALDSKQKNSALQLTSVIDRKCHFQDLTGIKESFKMMLGIDYIEAAQSNISPCAYGAKFFDQFSIKDVHPNWLGLIQRLYEERHNVVHDANYVIYKRADWSFLMNAESVAVVLPQFLLFYCINRFKMKREIMIMSDGVKQAPAIWGIAETISMDWKVAD